MQVVKLHHTSKLHRYNVTARLRNKVDFLADILCDGPPVLHDGPFSKEVPRSALSFNDRSMTLSLSLSLSLSVDTARVSTGRV